MKPELPRIRILKNRHGICRRGAWTANFGPVQLEAHIAKGCGEKELAKAIERRLCEGCKLFHLKQP
mgnify:CR=1 FL=1|jgi:hypothetical protein